MSVQLEWSNRVSTAPQLEPVTLEEAKRNCDVYDGDHTRDADFLGWIVEARKQVERESRNWLLTQTHTMQLSEWCGKIGLTGWPVLSVTSVKYQDTANAQQTLATSVYGSDINRRPALVYLKKLQTFPTLYGGHDDIEIIYQVGHGPNRSDVPPAAKAAIQMLVRHAFEQPDLLELSAMTEQPQGYQAKIAQLRGGRYP